MSVQRATLIVPEQDAPESLADSGSFALLGRENLARLPRVAAKALQAPVAVLFLVESEQPGLRWTYGAPDAFPGDGDLCLELLQGLVLRDRIPGAGDPPCELSSREIRAARALGCADGLGAPLTGEDGQLLGALYILDRQTRRWSEDDVAVLKDLAAVAASEVQNLLEASRIHERLRIQQAHWDRLLALAPVGIALLDRHGHVVQVNAEFTRLFAYFPEEVQGRNLNELIVPDELLNEAADLDERALQGEFLRETVVRRRKDGTRVQVSLRTAPVRVDGCPVAAYAIFQDRRDRQPAWEALQREEQRFRFLMENAADAAFVITAGGTIGYVTPSVDRVLGFAPDELVGSNLFSLVHPEDAPEAMRRFAAAIRGDLHQATVEVRVRHRDDTWRTLQVRANNLVDDPAVAGVVVNCRDLTDERRAEEGRRRLSAFLEATPDFVATFDSRGRALSVNRAFRRVVGLPEDDSLSTLNLPDLYPHHVTERIRKEGIPTAVREGVWVGETALQDSEGREIPISQVILAHKSAGGPVEFLSTLGRDISERKQAEEALRRSEQHFRALIESSSDVIAILDAEGVIRYESPSVERVLGYRPEELLGRHSFALIHPEDRERVRDFSTRLTSTMPAAPLELRLRHRDGGWRHFEVQARNLLQVEAVAGVVVNCRDITERTRAEEAVRRSEARVRAIFEDAAIGIALLDMRGRIVQANPALQDMLGYGEAELQERGLASLIVPDESTETPDLFAELVAGQRDSYRLERRYRRKSGKDICGRLTASLVHSAEGRPQFAVVMIEDVTEQKRTEEALRRSEEQLRQSQKMEAVGRLAGGVAHDFNNLLTAIKGFTELLLMDFDEGDTRRTFATEIQSAANRAAALTRQLLAFSRKQVLQPKVLDLNASVTEMQKMLRRLIGEDIEFVAHLAPELGRVRADPGQVEQVLLNLVVNARDAMPEGGRLALETAEVKLDAMQLPRHWNVRPGPYVQLTVRDSGAGMTPDVQERVFEPFFTTKEQGKGTGLGLSTVYGIIKQSGGYIAVESEPGQGTAFHIYLPRVEASAEPRSPEEKVAPTAGSEVVLVVEDETAVRVLIRRVLQRAGYQVLEAESGPAALELLARRDEPVDLLLTDVVMPGMSGRELADQLQARDPTIRVLYMSGYTDELIAQHGVLESGVSLIEKPFTPDLLLQRLREVLSSVGGRGRRFRSTQA